MSYDGPDRRRERDTLPARMASVETWQDMHGAECERRYGDINKKTDEIKTAVAAGNSKLDRTEKRLLYGLLAIGGMFFWEYFIKRLYLG